MPPRRAPSSRTPSTSTRQPSTRSTSRSVSAASAGASTSANTRKASKTIPPEATRETNNAKSQSQRSTRRAAPVKTESSSGNSEDGGDDDDGGDGENDDDSDTDGGAPSDQDEEEQAASSDSDVEREDPASSKPRVARRTTKAASAAPKKAVANRRSVRESESESESEDGHTEQKDAHADSEASLAGESSTDRELPPPKRIKRDEPAANIQQTHDTELKAPSSDSKDEEAYATATEQEASSPEKATADLADETEQADKSESFDADATFVAPSRSSSTLPNLPPATSRASLASSLAGAGPGSVPATPRTKGSVPATPAQNQPTTRLVIHKLLLQDFKSYAGLQTIGPFHKSFSAVVGPNGSGKSNVIDSLLFVFGWRANKMRQGKLSELIHSSSQAGKARPSETKVSVVFREIVDLPGPDAYRIVPNSKLVVSRTAYLNNSSVYHLNGKKSSFTEVTTLLRQKGIDLDHKRFLILQGEVESIAQMPPKARNEHEEGLLEYLEDIIGTSRFKEDIEEANKTVDDCNEQRGERLGRLKIVQREKDALEPKKREAESLLRDHNALTEQQSMLWQVYMWESRVAMEKASTSVQSLTQRIESEREKHKDAQSTVAELESSYTVAKKEWDELKKDVDKLAKEVEKCERENLQIGESRKHLETKKKKAAKSVAEDKRHLTEARNTQSSAEEDIERLKSEIEKLESSLETEEASLETIRDSLKGKTGHLTAQVEAKQGELAPWMAKLKEKENARDVRTQEVNLIKGREEAREQELQAAQQHRNELKDQLKQKEEELMSLGEEKQDVGGHIQKSEAELEKVRGQYAKLKGTAANVRAKADEAKTAQQATASQSSVLSALSRQAELGMIKGFHGRLGSLGVIDDKFDVAVSTACPGLDNIVVDTVECAQACIEYLRKNNVGRGNFIVLNSISNAPVERIETPENVPRLVDLVRAREPRFMPAFYFQMKDTLVARDLAHANRIAYGVKRWRVVTLDGQLIDKSGTMSGGGTRVARGGMSSKFADAEYTPEQIIRLQTEATQLEGEVQALSMQLQRRETELRDMRDRPGQIDIEIEKANMALKVDKERLSEASKRMEELKAQNKPDASDTSRLRQLQTEIASLDKEIEKLTSQTSVYEAEIAALQDKILDAGGVGLRAQQSKVDGMKEMLDLSSEKMTKAEVSKTKADKDIVKLEASLQKQESAIAEVEEELSGLQGSKSDQDGRLTKVRSKLEDKQAQMEEKQETRDDLKARLDESSSTINAFRSLEVEIKQKIEDNQRSLSDNERKVRHWEEKHEKLELHHFDDDDEEDDDDEGAEDANEDGSAGDEAAQDADKSSDAEMAEAAEATTPAASKHGKKSAKKQAATLPTFDDDDLSNMNKDSIKAEIAFYEERVQKGSGNFAILDEYRKREQEFLARARDLEETTQKRDAAKQRYDELRKQRLDEFMAGFGTISSKLKEMYQTITLGGNAELELVDSLDPFSEGILFSVMPPKKSWKNISNLSGGEKTLSSLALVFALHVFKPTPLYVMDEIDAALDFRNVSIVANLIKERTKNAQFVIISLRNNMFELSSRLVGIYKTNGRTKSIPVENTELSQAMAEEAAATAATVAASARKAKMFPNPPKTPGSALAAPRAHVLGPSATMSNLSRFASQGGGMPRSSSTLSSMPSTPSRPGAGSASQPVAVNGPASIFKKPQMSASASLTGLPQTPLKIPQTPRLPKSILARTPRVPSATPRVPSGGSQVPSGSSQRSSMQPL